MLGIPIKDYKGNEAVVLAYAVSVTDTINSFPTLSFSFDATGQNLQVEGMIGPDTTFTVDGQKYRLTTSNPVPNTSYRVYAITATHVGYDLHGVYQKATLTGVQPLKACLDLMVQDTPFQYQVDGNFSDHDFGTDTIGNGHGDDILSAIAQAWACEYWFDNHTVHIAKTIGDKDSFVFVDRVNTTSISYNEDYSNMYTAIHGYGKQNEQDTSSNDGTVTTTTKSDFINYVKSFVEKVPYLWGGSTTNGWDCSGFVAYVFNHFGVSMHQPTTYEEFQGTVVSPPYQTGDMLFWGARGSTYHVAIALDANTLVMAANEQRGTVIQSISVWPPSFGVRNASLSAKLQDTASADDTSTTQDLPVTYTCEADYISPLVDKGVAKRWDAPFSSDTITDEQTLKNTLKAKLHDYPDVQYTMGWVDFKSKALGFSNDIKAGNTGWIRDRYGTDVSVRIQSFTRYLDGKAGNNSTITFGNKIFSSSIWDTRAQQLADAQSLIKQEIQRITARQNIVRSDDVPTLTEKEVANLEQYVGSNDATK